MNTSFILIFLSAFVIIQAGPVPSFGVNGFNGNNGHGAYGNGHNGFNGHGSNGNGFSGFSNYRNPWLDYLWGNVDDDDFDDHGLNWGFPHNGHGHFGGLYPGMLPHAGVAPVAPVALNFGQMLPAPAAPVAPSANSVPYGSDYVSPDGSWPRYNGLGLFNRYGAFLGKKK